MPAVDPVLSLMLRIAFALLFAWASLHKLSEFASFRAALGNYRVLPEPIVPAMAGGVAALEAALAVALLVPVTAGPASLTAMGLLGLYTAAISINLSRGRREVDCGCAGPAGRQPLRASLVLRNLGLMAMAGVCALPVLGRAWVWVDSVTLVAGVAVLGLLYLALDLALANAARVQRWSTQT